MFIQSNPFESHVVFTPVELDAQVFGGGRCGGLIRHTQITVFVTNFDSDWPMLTQYQQKIVTFGQGQTCSTGPENKGWTPQTITPVSLGPHTPGTATPHHTGIDHV